MAQPPLCADLRALDQSLRERIRDYLDGHGVSEDALECLAFIGEHPDCRTGELLAALHLDRAALGRSLAALGTRGFIRKSPCRADRRAYVLRLTPAGQAVTAAVEEVAQRWSAEVSRALGEEDFAALSRAVRRLREAARQTPPEAGAPAQPV